MKLPELVIWDNDGVIIDSERIFKECMKKSLVEYGYPDNQEVIDHVIGQSRKNSIEYLNKLYKGNAAEMFENASRMMFQYFEEYHPEPKKGFRELYQFYKDHHVKMCLASSSRKNTIDRHLKNLGLIDAFDHIFSGEDVQYSKPDPEIFLNACQYFHIDPKNALVIEDSKNGILAAVNANIPVIGVLDTIYHPREIMEKTLAMVPSLDCILKLYQDPKLVLFDMDGLLVDTESLWIEPYTKAFQDYGYTISQEVLDATIGASGVILENILKTNQKDDFPLEAIMKRADQYYFSIIQNHLPVKPGAFTILEYYKQKQIPCIVASSSPRSTIELYIQKAKLEGYFAEICCLDDVSHSKPDPEIFLKGCEKMNISKDNALIYEDSQNGIIAASRAGIPVICIPDLIYHKEEIFKKTLCFSKSLINLTQF